MYVYVHNITRFIPSIGLFQVLPGIPEATTCRVCRYYNMFDLQAGYAQHESMVRSYRHQLSLALLGIDKTADNVNEARCILHQTQDTNYYRTCWGNNGELTLFELTVVACLEHFPRRFWVMKRFTT